MTTHTANTRHDSASPPADTATTIAWLLAGDPAIRWQTLRDVQAAPADVWQTERRRTLTEGWGAQLLALQDADGRWGGGIYSPKWTSTIYTLLVLRDIGIPSDTPAAVRGADIALREQLGERCDAAFAKRLARCDRCIVGMVLGIAVYFGIDDARIEAIVENLLAEMMADGGWNCQRQRHPRPTHSSFHTTLNVLEGLRVYLEARATPLCRDVRTAEQSALELLSQHQLYRSDKTGAVINEAFTRPVYPYRWHYDVLRGLVYFARADAPRDPRVQAAVQLLLQQRRADGSWSAGKQYPGRVFFRMEAAGPSRWNTLRALRVLRWWRAGQDTARAGMTAASRI